MAPGTPTGASGRACGVVSVGLAIDAHVRLLRGSEGVVHAVAPGAVEADAVSGIGRQELRLGAVEQPCHVSGARGIPTQEPVVAEDPEIAGLRARSPPRFLQRLVKVEALDVLALLAGLKLSEQILHLVLTEPRERQVDVGSRLQVSEEAGEELLVPGAADLVEGETEEPSLLDRHIEPGDGDRGQAETACRHEALVAADDRPILASGEHRLDEAELAKAALQRVELVVADPPRVCGVRPEVVDRDRVDGEGGERGRRGHASWALLMLPAMRTSVLCETSRRPTPATRPSAQRCAMPRPWRRWWRPSFRRATG